jgi:hypothetical protein
MSADGLGFARLLSSPLAWSSPRGLGGFADGQWAEALRFSR